MYVLDKVSLLFLVCSPRQHYGVFPLSRLSFTFVLENGLSPRSPPFHLTDDGSL